MARPPTTLVLVRHGEVVRPTDTSNFDKAPLSTKGESQVATVGHHWPVARPEAVYASDLLRAVQTGKILATMLHAPLALRVGLREWTPSPGDLTQEAYSAVEARCWADLDWVPPSGESLHQAQDRIARTLRDIARAHRGATVAVVGHGAVFSLFTSAVEGVLPTRDRKDAVPFAGYATVSYAGRFSVASDFRVIA